MRDLFKGRKIVIATKHRKEEVMAPLLQKELGLECIVTHNLDTDKFGTFTGEVERLYNPLETARLKCLKAMELSGCDVAIANEGSFGPHPTVFFLPANSEVVVLMDKKNKLEFVAQEISTKTNFNGNEITSFDALEEFAKSVLFPLHGLILRPSKDATESIYKGITTVKDMKQAYDSLMNKYAGVYAETDMRALYNPTRMAVIETAVKKLITKIKTLCPDCSAPGFSVTESKPGLPCDRCGAPTRSTLKHVSVCMACGFKEEKKFPNGKVTEDPMYCDVCNP